MILKIKNKLYNNEEQIINILNKVGCTKIHKTEENQIRFGRDEESSGSANIIFTDTLFYISHSENVKGDIITLVSDFLSITIGEAINWLAKELNIKAEYTPKEINLPFNGFFKNISKAKELDESPPLTYDLSKLKQYKHGVSKLFIDDGISAITQEVFNIGYDMESNRVTIPWLSETGELVGIMGRINIKNMSDKEKQYKYLPIIPFSKSKVLYGYYENYKGILETNTMIIVESEKSILKARQMGFNNVVALGGNEIHPRQQRLIKTMFCNVIIALDEGLSLEHCIKQAEKCRINNPFFQNEVYVVQMNNNKYIKETKVSIMDLDKQTVNKILDEYLIYIE